MKFLFVAPRFHTNQIPIIDALLNKDHTVVFFSQRAGHTEDYTLLKPFLLKKSFIWMILEKIIDLKYPPNKAETIKVNIFIPSLLSMYKKIKNYSPDVVILRNRNITSLISFFVCRLLGIKKVLLYNQTPMYLKGNHSLTLYKKILRKMFFPKVRITPVWTDNILMFNKNKNEYSNDKNTYFVPFIGINDKNILQRNYFSNNRINILSIGKFRDYKNHYLLVDAISLIDNKEELLVTIVGQASNKEEIDYSIKLKEYIRSSNLSSTIKIVTNIPYRDMKSIYLTNDIFILTSKHEIASISVIESMSYGLVTISSSKNGTATYINSGECGYVFESENVEDLASKLDSLIMNKSVIPVMGRKAVENIYNNYLNDSYYNSLMQVFDKEFCEEKVF